ncbi:MAG: hypothetical protein IJJ33_06790, partial [Victivallales bacterium]|nr:hypothetical protein [Victivallales bacterium]
MRIEAIAKLPSQPPSRRGAMASSPRLGVVTTPRFHPSSSAAASWRLGGGSAMTSAVAFITLMLVCAAAHAVEIVLPSGAHHYERLAAEELREALTQGGCPEVAVTDKKAAGPAILLGRALLSSEFPQEQFPQDVEGWVIRSSQGDLLIAGTRPIGTLYGAYSLLRRLG